MFGGVGFDSIGEYFKEQVAKYIISKIAPGEENGWIAGIIEKLIGNTPITDIPKLLNCDYLVPKLSVSIVEEVIDKAKNSMGLSGAISDIIRNGIVTSLDKTELAKNLEKSLTSVVCPALSKVSGKLMNFGDNMKEKALAA
jgi:hypothetical protein